jgi:hypothetical protein
MMRVYAIVSGTKARENPKKKQTKTLKKTTGIP